MLKRSFIFSICVVISFCVVTCIESKICYGIKAKVEQSSEDIALGEDGKEELAGGKYNINLFVLIIKAIFSLIIITVLIYFILRFFLKGQRWITKQSGLIQIIATHPLAPNKYIQIVEIGNKLLVLGVSEHNINLLTEIVDKEVIDFIKIQSSKQEDKMQLSFIQHLKNKLRVQEIQQTDYDEKLKFLNKQRERLRKLEA
ncbi:MAG: flagellar biosynthetic protein FliO [bacterium]